MSQGSILSLANLRLSNYHLHGRKTISWCNQQWSWAQIRSGEGLFRLLWSRCQRESLAFDLDTLGDVSRSPGSTSSIFSYRRSAGFSAKLVGTPPHFLLPKLVLRSRTSRYSTAAIGQTTTLVDFFRERRLVWPLGTAHHSASTPRKFCRVRRTLPW